ASCAHPRVECRSCRGYRNEANRSRDRSWSFAAQDIVSAAQWETLAVGQAFAHQTIAAARREGDYGVARSQGRSNDHPLNHHRCGRATWQYALHPRQHTRLRAPPMTARETMMADRFTVGLFSLNASGGIAMTTVPERWRAEWNDIRAVVQIADSAGLDFLLPLQRWCGYGGESDPRGVCMETMTHAAALVGITSRIALFATAQTSILHPTWTARALATIDHASGGRAGLNIVAGMSTISQCSERRTLAPIDVMTKGPSGRRFSRGRSVATRLSISPANIFRLLAPIAHLPQSSREDRR